MMKRKGEKILIFLVAVFTFTNVTAQTTIRRDIPLDKGWHTVADDHNQYAFNGFEKAGFNTQKWKQVDVPHNWDEYEGYRRLIHGNRHGYAWYRRSFNVAGSNGKKRYFLWFEGVGSYATVWLNGKKVGYHAGGRTSFTIDVTDAIHTGNKSNLLAVRADHPAFIKDLPWVCGGCSDERGFSEGSQPMGIFRPVHLIITDPVRIEPFGVHIWNDTTISERSADLYLETEVKNYGSKAESITVLSKLLDHTGALIVQLKADKQILSGTTVTVKQQTPEIANPHLWSLKDPYLYTLVSEVYENGKLIDHVQTPYGIRWISWPVGRKTGSNQFFLNGKPVFINGIAEYEHLLGQSHAFSAEQVRSRVMQVRAAGFNAFRDAHQPHNLRYQEYWDKLGVLWWPQMSAHIWFDTPEFRKNFKVLLTDWVKERRNSPSLVLWGLQNESKLPEDFAKECSDIIRLLDPTASSQRKITTCNGGTGIDWDVPQNWTGTYGGNPATYADDVKRQKLIGEYGAWRTIDLHTEGPFQQDGVLSEDRMTQLMEMKIRLAESVKDSTCGQFFWLFNSHDNPGRVQSGEGFRELDRIGPVNYKGLLTSWEEPTDAFYMFRSNYAPKDKEPMVYIVSHTWPDRWTSPGKRDSIVVYSNCDEVELFNDVNHISLGKRKRAGIGTHFQWDNVNINYNVLYAVGYVNGKKVAQDCIVLHHLPQSPHFNKLLENVKPFTSPKAGYNYLYRVNCGGPDYTDKNGNTWMSDRKKTSSKTWGSGSWTDDFPGLPAFFASQRRTSDPIKGTTDWPLFQSFRYGRDKLHYDFPVPDGDYLVELYFTEPWLGTGGGMDCTGWRLFDVGINGKTVLKNLDIWKEAGHEGALKKTVKVHASGGQLVVSFPHVLSGQAVISAIAVAAADHKVTPAPGSLSVISHLKVTNKASAGQWSVQTWMDTGDRQYSDEKTEFSALPPKLYGAEWIRLPNHNTAISGGPIMAQFDVNVKADVYVGVDTQLTQKSVWLQGYEDVNSVVENDHTGRHRFKVYRKRFPAGATVVLGKNGKTSAGDTQMYIVAVLPASTIQPAYDLKPVASYKAEKARIRGVGAVRESVNDKQSITFKRAEDSSMEWDIAIGVADTYSLTVRYYNPTSRTLTGKLEVLSADGTVMKEEKASFSPTRPGKWNYLNSTTGTMINAGNYKVRITATDAGNLSVYDLQVQ